MPVTIIDVTSGLIRKLLAYLEDQARYLETPPELKSLFPRNFTFDFSRIRVSVQLSEERLRYDEARQRERASGVWLESSQQGQARYAQRSIQEYEEQAQRAVVRDWEQVRGDLHRPHLQRAIILGDPGFGKSWLLRYEGRALARAEMNRLQRSEVGTAEVLIPVFARLARLAEQEGSLLERLRVVLLEREREVPWVADLWDLIAEKAQRGQALLLLDGWDEVRQGREKLTEALETFARSYPQCRLYLTSRIAGHVQLNLGAQEWELASLSPRQIEAFVQNFFSMPTQQQGEALTGREQQAEKGPTLLRDLRQHPPDAGAGPHPPDAGTAVSSCLGRRGPAGPQGRGV